MITANEIRTQQSKFTREIEVAEYLKETQKNALDFANTILNEELTKKANTRGDRITWAFISEDYREDCFINDITREKRARPVREVIVATKAHRLERVLGFWKGIDLNVLKEYLEQHGYRVFIRACDFEEESWSRKSSWIHHGFRVVISWEEEE